MLNRSHVTVESLVVFMCGCRDNRSREPCVFPFRRMTLQPAISRGSHSQIAVAMRSVPESRWSETMPLEAVRGFPPTRSGDGIERDRPLRQKMNQ